MGKCAFWRRATDRCKIFKFWNFWECPRYEIWEYAFKDKIMSSWNESHLMRLPSLHTFMNTAGTMKKLAVTSNQSLYHYACLLVHISFAHMPAHSSGLFLWTWLCSIISSRTYSNVQTDAQTSFQFQTIACSISVVNQNLWSSRFSTFLPWTLEQTSKSYQEC